MATTFDIQLPHYPRGFHLITRDILSLLPDLPENGLLVVFIKHTSAGITINENADPDVVTDLLLAYRKAFPDRPEFRHAEGNSSAHARASAVGSSAMIPVKNGRLVLGTWQGVYFCEFDGPRRRTFLVTVMEAHDKGANV